MSPKLGAGIFGLSMLALPLWGDAGPSEQVQSTNTERVNFALGGTINVNGSFGYLMVEGWDRPEVEVTVTKWTDDYYPPKDQKLQDEAAARLKDVRVTTEPGSGAKLTISTEPAGGKRHVTAEYEIHVPRDSRLVIHHGAGSVAVSKVTGDIEVTGRRGDIVLMLSGQGVYAIDAKCKVGNVTSAFAGDMHHPYLVGERFGTANAAPSRRIYLRMGIGGITIQSVPPEAY